MTTNATGAIFGGNLSFGKAGLAAGTTTTSTIANQTDFAIGGASFRKAAASNAATPTTDIVTGAAFRPLIANQACIFLYALDSGGTIRVAQGPIVTLSDVTGLLSAVHFPGLPDTLAPIGYLYAQAGTTTVGTWTFGTNNLSGVTGLTYTFRDINTIPGQPITS